MKGRMTRFLAMLLVVVMVVSLLPMGAFAAFKYDETATDSYYKLISQKYWQLAPGIEETEVVINNPQSTRRQVVHSVKVDMNNPYTNIIPGYKGMIPEAGKYGTQTVSKQALAAEKKTGYDFSFVTTVCEQVKRCVEAGAQVGIVVGGGNFWRGVKDGDGKIERVSADRMGMLATAMNGLALADVFAQCGVKAKLLTAVDIQGVGERYDTKKAIEYLESGTVVIFGCGTGMPFFSTDTAAVLRAAEIHADAILLAKNIDGVYSDDPRKNPAAVKYDEISYGDVLAQRLAVMDSTATSLAMDNSIPVIVFALAEPENIVKVLAGEKLGTLVK